jgi:hypothetical protein
VVSWLVSIAQNLAASLIWGVPAFVHLHMRLNRHHARIRAELEAGSDHHVAEAQSTATA